MAVQCTVQRAPAAGTVTVPEPQAPPSGRETIALTHLRADLKKTARAHMAAGATITPRAGCPRAAVPGLQAEPWPALAAGAGGKACLQKPSAPFSMSPLCLCKSASCVVPWLSCYLRTPLSLCCAHMKALKSRTRGTSSPSSPQAQPESPADLCEFLRSWGAGGAGVRCTL